MSASNPLKGVKTLVIYLGNTCNFDCIYCDRAYISDIGGQHLKKSTGDDMQEFFQWVARKDNDVQLVVFHGGEPLLFINQMERMMQWLYPLAKENDWKVCMTTNGSLVKENEWFFEKYNKILRATVSYDFAYQGINRESFDVIEMAEVLNKYCEWWHWQFVLPIEDPAAFSFENIKHIVSTCYRTQRLDINIIPLRHMRGKDKFDVIIDRINLPHFLDAFLQFLQILYIKKLRIHIDGAYNGIDKAYFGEHYKLILSTDGYMYPEFDFLESKIEESRIGNWQNKTIWKNSGDDGRILSSCQGCEKQASCGLKYLYHLFEETPKGACKEFYRYMDYAIMHLAKLNEQKSLLHHIGIKDITIK